MWLASAESIRFAFPVFRSEFMSEIPDFPIGTKFKTRGTSPKVCTVTDILKTYNTKNELVSVRYVATHDFMGQTLTHSDVLKTTISIGWLSEPGTETLNMSDWARAARGEKDRP